jgi:hypothetical protein
MQQRKSKIENRKAKYEERKTRREKSQMSRVGSEEFPQGLKPIFLRLLEVGAEAPTS